MATLLLDIARVAGLTDADLFAHVTVLEVQQAVARLTSNVSPVEILRYWCTRVLFGTLADLRKNLIADLCHCGLEKELADRGEESMAGKPSKVLDRVCSRLEKLAQWSGIKYRFTGPEEREGVARILDKCSEVEMYLTWLWLFQWPVEEWPRAFCALRRVNAFFREELRGGSPPDRPRKIARPPLEKLRPKPLSGVSALVAL
jgi:hypothetical protein